MNRREALKFFLTGGVAATLVPAWGTVAEALAARTDLCGVLSFRNLHTDESLTLRYLDRNGRPDPAGLDRLNRLFRCPYTGEVHPIDPKLFLLLDAASCEVGAREHTFELISGYRSPEYNALLRQKSSHVAKNSYHTRGKAADVRLEGVSLDRLRAAARRLREGGIGRYPDFVHLDVGPIRCW